MHPIRTPIWWPQLHRLPSEPCAWRPIGPQHRHYSARFSAQEPVVLDALETAISRKHEDLRALSVYSAIPACVSCNVFADMRRVCKRLSQYQFCADL
eukprot:3544008-Pleurochrysis_carterae.AAC.2